MKSAVAYCRTGNALQGDGLVDVQRQANAIQRYAKGRGEVIREPYMDAGVSGTTLDRLALQKLLADCRAEKIGTVLTQDPNRLSRDTGQLIELLGNFLESGVRIQFSTKAAPSQYVFLETLLSGLAELGEAQRRT
jgi:DNA invertase Pin-like site-specific DNA recombinase